MRFSSVGWSINSAVGPGKKKKKEKAKRRNISTQMHAKTWLQTSERIGLKNKTS